MLKKKIKITHPRGIHLKPATMIAQYCLQHQEVNLTFHKGGLEVRGDSVMSILSLELNKGSTVILKISQNDHNSKKILDHIIAILNGKIG